MPVTLTSPVMGQEVDSTYTGPEEAWLLAHGYAKQDGYTGPGVANSGATDVTPDQDLTLAVNREDPGESFDPDQGGVDTEPPTVTGFEPDEGPAAGGDVVTITGDDLTGVTGVTFDAVAATDVTVVDDNTVEVTTPAGTAGPADVVVTDANGADTVVGAYTYV